MNSPSIFGLICDGCGQPASPEHIARRLARLEWTTRYRPVHIQLLYLGGVAPAPHSSFLYAPEAKFEGEAARVLEAAQVSNNQRSHEEVLTEFQKRGLLLAHVLECPIDQSLPDLPRIQQALEQRLPAAFARIRRSLRPKRIVLISEELAPFLERLRQAGLGCPVETSW